MNKQGEGDFLMDCLPRVLLAIEQQLIKSVPAKNAGDEIQQSGDRDMHRHSHHGERP